MRRAAVALYCAVVDRLNHLVSTCTTAAREMQAVFNQPAEGLRTWLGALNLGSVQAWQRESEDGAARPMGGQRQPGWMRTR